MRKRLTAALLCLCLLFTLLPATAFAEGEPDSGPPPAQSALCEHHPQHDESCGYTEGTEGSPCTHEHDEDCYTLVTECVHEHTTECYPAESVSENTATPSEAEEAEPTACTHVCSEESGCITMALDCKHEHDEACGYVPATEGTPCTFVCEVCNTQDKDSGTTATPSDAQPEECTCETLCTGDNINGNCPVCGAEGADLNECEGLESQPATLSNALPVTALAATPNGQVIYVGDETVTNGGYWTTDSDGSVTPYTEEGTPTDNYIHYDAADNTLTLHNATIRERVPSDTSTYVMGAGIGVFNQNDASKLTIKLEGSNAIENVSTGICVLAFSYSTGNASLTITGSGSLDTSGRNNPAIRVQSNGGNATLSIENAKVTATASSSGYGVLVQSKNDSSVSLTVDGGSLTATGSGNDGAGIQLLFGSGDSGSGTPTVTVSNNAIMRASGNADGIATNSTAATPSGTGIVFDGGTGTVYGSVTLQEDLEIGEGESLNIPDGSSLTIPDDKTLTVNGGELTGNVPQSGVTYKVTEVTLSQSNLTLGVGESETLTATITPDNATEQDVTWSSDPSGIVDITPDTADSKEATITATGTGTTTIKATVDGKSAECSVTVNAPAIVPVTGVSLNKTELTLTEGNSETLTATVEPANATNKNVTWSSSAESVATVEDGKVTAVGAGEATITVTTEDGSFTDTCEVTVTAKTYGISVSPSTLDFDSVTEGYQAAPAAQTVTITNTGNQTVTVNLPASTNYTVTAETGFTGGTATLSPNGTATFTVQPKTGLAAGSYDETLTISGDNNTSANIALSFEVDVKLYSVTVNGSYAQTTGTGSYAEGATVAIDAGTRSGYTFDGWTSSDGVTFANAGSAQTTFTMPDKAVTVTANWTKKSTGGGGGGGSSYDYYTISATAGEGGSISPSGNISVREGRDKTFTITPADGYIISDVRVDGVSVGAVASYTFDNVRRSHTIEATFAKGNPATGNPFTDVHPDDWFYDHVMFVYQNGLMNGTSATTFSPNDPITRAQAAVILYRMAGSPAVTGDSAFTDVVNGPGTAWYYNAVLWAQQNGIVSGYGDGTFRPGTDITREQLAVIFYNYAKHKGYDVSATNDLSGFTDAGDVSDWALPAMRWAVGSGIMGGYGDGILGPQGTATRAQVAAMLRRFIENNKLVPPAVVPGGDSGTTGTGGTGNGGGGWTQQITSPQTGDSSNIGLWFSLMLLSLSGIAALLVTEKVQRRRMEDEEAPDPLMI